MNPNHSRVAIHIKTCQGRPSLLWVLNSIKYNLKNINYRIYIADEKPLDDWKIPVYERLSDQGHYIELQKSGISCGLARNKLVEQLLEEEFILRLDDDFELGGNFNFSALETVINASEKIGFCSDFEKQVGKDRGVKSGAIRPAGGTFQISAPKLIMKFHSPWRKYKTRSDIRYTLAEHTRNLMLIKREVVEKVKWNEDLLFQGEHIEFMLSIKEAGYCGAYTPDSIHYHRDDLAFFRNRDNQTDQEKNNRPGETEKEKVLMEKIGCNQIVTRYPVSWYLAEAGRRIVDKISL